jgi:hypothetical protein
VYEGRYEKLPAIKMQVFLNNFQNEIVTKEVDDLLCFCSEEVKPPALKLPYHHD